MHIRAYNCRDSYMKKLIRLGVEDYCTRLFQPNLLNKVKINVMLKDSGFEVDGDKDVEGFCEIMGWNYRKQPREFKIQLIKQSPLKLFSALAHEVVHVWQFSHGFVDDELAKWRGKRIPKHTEYWDEPWEIEAYGRAPGLVARFKKRYELDKFFKRTNAEKKYIPYY